MLAKVKAVARFQFNFPVGMPREERRGFIENVIHDEMHIGHLISWRGLGEAFGGQISRTIVVIRFLCYVEDFVEDTSMESTAVGAQVLKMDAQQAGKLLDWEIESVERFGPV